jgi:Putative Actinobacterial Holin-X, holin superfamily III
MSTESTRASGAGSGGLAAEVVQDVQRLVSLEVALARQELKELAITNVIAMICFGVGALLAALALLVAVPVVVVLLVPWHWEAAVVWAAAYVLIALVLALYGRMRLHIGMPEKTIASLKETRTWALHRMRSTGR